MAELGGSVALVTGAGSGIGRAIAAAFAAKGAKVALCDIDMAAAEASARMLAERGAEALPIRMDVAAEAEVEAGVDAAVRRFGRLDTMVSNAGIQIVHPIEEFPYEEFRRMLDIHLGGAFLLTKACVRHMYPQKSGSLIYMGSVHSHRASPLKSAYVAAKHGILGLGRVMAIEGAPHGVRANVICPGFVRTPLVDKQIPEQAAKLNISEADVVSKIMLKDTVDGEFTTLDDVADTAVFLAGFRSQAFTGQSITVSHGWHMA